MPDIRKSSLRRLNEIDFMRPIVIVLLVTMHSFTMYAGGWHCPVGIDCDMVPAYKWIQIITYGCMLEAFTFISGYLFGFQLKYKKPSFRPMIVSKLKRLIAPSLMFSVLYVILFQIEWWGVNDWLSIVFDIISGAGHLWYLPMLFWCFIITWLLSKTKINKSLVLIALFALSIAAVLPIPLKFNAVFHYLPYFYLGVAVFDYKPQKCTLRKAMLLLIVFILFLVLVTLYRETHPILALWKKMVLWYLKQIYAAIGTMGIFVICKLLGEKKEISAGLLQFNVCCFGIYIFHQFILKLIYYKTSMPLFCGTYWLPWMGLFCTFIVAFGLTWLFRKTQIGRFLFG